MDELLAFHKNMKEQYPNVRKLMTWQDSFEAKPGKEPGIQPLETSERGIFSKQVMREK